ncbi:MAG: N-acetylneuraminate synthase family protein, partial [Cohaesibacteraceae bacterium]|nr:N-acetylneuraminate synthase family protein [Cohaesibacteraceae bacterium]
MRDTVFQLGAIPVGRAHPPLFLADIGTFFGQNMAEAHRMVDGLKEAGCTIIKGEILHRADICLDDDTMEKYYDPVRGMISERHRDLIERKIISFENYKTLIDYCKSLRMELVMSVYDLEGVDFAIAQGVAGLKIASSNISHEPLIRYVAQKRVPMFVDTGKSTFVEIAQAVQWIRDEGHDAFVLQHSPAAPPAPIVEQRLRMLNVLGEAFNCE